MEFSSKSLDVAVNEISKLPGIGKRSALRLALYLLKQPKDFSFGLSKAINELRENIIYCNFQSMNHHNIIYYITLSDCLS